MTDVINLDNRYTTKSYVSHKDRVLNRRTLILCALVILCSIAYLLVNVSFEHINFVMSLRAPRLVAILIAASAIGSASLIFQSLINNNIVTPCLLGMNALYLLLHTALVALFGMSSFIIQEKTLSFFVDITLMGIVATALYGYIFKKTNYNILYVLLIGTVMTTLFSSITNTIVRAMDPNEYDALLTTLVASFSNVNKEILSVSALMTLLIFLVFIKSLKTLDVIALGKPLALNLGVFYDKETMRLLLLLTVLIAIATALVGPISFIGLLTSNIARMIFKTYRHKYLVTGSVLVSALVLIAGQLLVEHVFHLAIPISVFITIGGGLYFLYLVINTCKKGI